MEKKNIKWQLKSLDVKISKLASGLEISRPTFDAYVDLYESNQQLPNEKYQEIFDYLFDEEIVSPIDFAQKYDYVKRVFLEKNDSEKQDDQKRRTFLSHSLSKYAYDTNTSIESLEFLYLILRSSDNQSIKLLEQYICLANGISDWTDKELTNEQKAYFSSISKFFEQFKNSELAIDESRIDDLLKKNKEMVQKRNKKDNEKELIHYLEGKGLDHSSINIEYIKSLLKEGD